MKKPKVVLKKVKYHQGHEGDGVNADVWINGVNCLHALDDGNGGCLNITDNSYGSKNPDKVKNLVKELNDFVNTIPDKPCTLGDRTIMKDGVPKLFKVDLEDYINDLLMEHQKAKETKKQEKLMKTAILFGVPNGASYSYIKYKRPLSELSKPLLQKSLDKIVKENCINGVVIFNTNLKELGLTI